MIATGCSFLFHYTKTAKQKTKKVEWTQNTEHVWFILMLQRGWRLFKEDWKILVCVVYKLEMFREHINCHVTTFFPQIQDMACSSVSAGGDESRGVRRGARLAQFSGRRVTMGAPNDCGRRPKSQQCHEYFLQCSRFASERP